MLSSMLNIRTNIPLQAVGTARKLAPLPVVLHAMKKVLLILPLSLSPLTAISGDFESSIELFLKRDFEGARLKSYWDDPINSVIDWGEGEPGWDAFDITASFRVLEIDQSANTVKVEYSVIGICTATNTIWDEKKIEVLFRLEEIDDQFKIKSPVIPPRVSAKLACEKYGCCKENM